MAKKICIFLNGTIASSKKTSNGVLQNYLQTTMYNQQNIITELHANCLEPKINLDGPGTELLHTEPGLLAALASPLTITASLIDGGHGGRGVWANLSKLRAFIKQQSKTLQPGEALQIEVFGWSRGAYTALLLKNLIQEMRDQDPTFRGLKLSLNISAIDPVPGGPSDRFWLPKIENPKDVDVNTMIYYSDTGDLGTYSHYKSAMRDSRIKQNMPNSIFFSALDDNTDHTRKVLFQASHEAMAGTARGNGECREKYVGDLIAGDVLSLALSRHVHFNPVWQKKILKQGLESIPKYLDTNPQPAQNRKFLDPKNGYRFFGKDLSQVKNLELIGANPHLTTLKRSVYLPRPRTGLDPVSRVSKTHAPSLNARSSPARSPTYRGQRSPVPRSTEDTCIIPECQVKPGTWVHATKSLEQNLQPDTIAPSPILTNKEER